MNIEIIKIGIRRLKYQNFDFSFKGASGGWVNLTNSFSWKKTVKLWYWNQNTTRGGMLSSPTTVFHYKIRTPLGEECFPPLLNVTLTHVFPNIVLLMASLENGYFSREWCAMLKCCPAISFILVEGLQKYQRSRCIGIESGGISIFFSTSNFDQNEWLVPQLKDLYHICHGMTFKVCNVSSKYLYLTS